MSTEINDRNNPSKQLKINTDGSLANIDSVHQEVHEGEHFFFTDSNEIAAAGTVDYFIKTKNSNKHAHMFFNLDGSAITQFDIYEDSDKTGSTALTPFNSNRNSTEVASTLLYKAATGTADGTLIFTYKGGASTNQSKSSSSIRAEEEMVLKKNSKYLVRFVSGTNNNLTNIKLFWYEYEEV